MVIPHLSIKLNNNREKYNNNNNINSSYDINRLRKDNTTLYNISTEISTNFINNHLYDTNLNIVENGNN